MKTSHLTALTILSTLFYLSSLLYSPSTFIPPSPSSNSAPHAHHTLPFGPLAVCSVAVPIPVMAFWMHTHSIGLQHIIQASLIYVGSSMTTLGVTEHLKRLVGRPRPDYLARCNPDANGQCTGEKRLVAGGRMSFPSGHTSTSFTSAVFVTRIAYYLLRSIQAIFIIGLLSIGGASCVGVSRVMNHRHFISDVLGGAALGSLIGLAGCELVLVGLGIVKKRPSTETKRKKRIRFENEQVEV